MPIKSFRPITPTLRFQTKLVNDDITTDTPHKPLLSVKPRTGGRNNMGKLVIRHQGGGHKQKLRLIDFKRDKYGIPGTVATIEYDPNRSSRIALVHYADGEKRYIIQPIGLKVGQKIMSGPDADILVGNALPLKFIPTGTIVHNIELRPGKGAQMARSAGAQVNLVANNQLAHIVAAASAWLYRQQRLMRLVGRNVIVDQLRLKAKGRRDRTK